MMWSEFFESGNGLFDASAGEIVSRVEPFNLFAAWRGLKGTPSNEARAAIARGEDIFNTLPFRITGVAGLNDQSGRPTIIGSCATCHNNPNVGNNLEGALFNTSVATGPGREMLPLFTLQCTGGPLTGQIFESSDPGRALITGKRADIGKFKVPTLRGLAARPPYFHDGGATTLMDVVNFYNFTFDIGLTEGQKNDLVTFLQAL